MKTISQLLATVFTGAALFTAAASFAAESKGYQVTGDLKVGSKVTIYHTMVADDVEVKADKKK